MILRPFLFVISTISVGKNCCIMAHFSYSLPMACMSSWIMVPTKLHPSPSDKSCEPPSWYFIPTLLEHLWEQWHGWVGLLNRVIAHLNALLCIRKARTKYLKKLRHGLCICRDERCSYRLSSLLIKIIVKPSFYLLYMNFYTTKPYLLSLSPCVRLEPSGVMRILLHVSQGRHPHPSPPSLPPFPYLKQK